MALPALRTRRWDAVRSRIGPRVLTAILAVGAAAGWFAADLFGVHHPQPSPAWTPVALFAAFLLAEGSHIHIEFRRQNNSVSLSEIPLVLGLFLVDPLTLLVVRLLAAVVVSLLQHRAAVKAIFNLALFSAEVVVAAVVFYAFRSHAISHPLSWLAVLAALAAVTSLTVGAMQAVISLTDGPQSLARVGMAALLQSLLVTLNGAVGLVILMVLDVNAWGGIVLVVLCAVLLLAYRTYSRSFRQHANLRRVYGFSRLLELTRSADAPLGSALNEARDVLNASRLTLRLFGENPLSLSVDGDGHVSTPPDLDPEDPIAARARNSRSGVLLTGRKSEAALAARGAREIVLVPLRSGPNALGHLEFSDRQNSLSRYTAEDVQVADSLATRLTAAIENQDLVARLRHAAYHDLLTGLPTRARLGQHLEAAIDEGGDGVVALVQLDLDRFKEVNDSLGHTWGDELLVLVGQRLLRTSPAGAMVARVGADEFAVACRVSGAGAAADLAATLREAVSTSYPLAGLTIDAAATVGVALAPDHGDDSPTLMRRVDVALSNAKNVGRLISMYDRSMEQETLQRLRLVTELRAALAAGQVVVRYQPKVNLRSRELVGVESLVRWLHPEYGEVAPDRFVPLAEVTGLIGVLTDHVLRASLAQCRQWLDRDLRIPVAVNLSARTLADADFPDRVAGMLREYEVPPELLSFELTESSVMTEPEKMKPVLHRLHELGTGLSIDDFGTGYSSLSQLRRLPVDEVKIDKEFVFTMGTDLGDLAIVRAIIELGHSLGLRVVAEGVEDELARDLLAGNDCDVIQGYLVSRALDPDRLDAWLSARTAIRPGQPGVKGRRLQLLTG
ncbi:MAG TPA: EAL domain-containing protein [Mycobacteriales bacterium]|jgi:diguanylate cyclase (GGDEF)-like protein|nr:EAL domain-containing protein [Mycobacteriales bacterium]